VVVFSEGQILASELLTISQLARCVGTSIAVVRAYGNTGLLQPPRPRGKARGRGASFGYDQQHVERVKFIQRALKYSFTIGDIALLIDAAAPIICRDVHQAATRRLQELQDTHPRGAAPVVGIETPDVEVPEPLGMQLPASSIAGAVSKVRPQT